MEVLQGKILIVDDEPDIVEFISYNLKSKGYLIATARDGIEAIRKAKEFLTDLILLDIMMPNKDGIETIRDLRKMPEFGGAAGGGRAARSGGGAGGGGRSRGADGGI